jgi:hypothetical protein
MKTTTTMIKKMIKQIISEAEQLQIPFDSDELEQQSDSRSAIQVAQANIDSLLGMNMPKSTPIGFVSDEGGYLLSYPLGKLGNYDLKQHDNRLSERNSYTDEVQMVPRGARIDGPTGFISIITVDN